MRPPATIYLLRHSLFIKKILPINRQDFPLEQGTGVEPAFTAWEAVVLPIYEPCIQLWLL